MSTQLIRPLQAQRLEIRCNVGDAVVANLATNVLLFAGRMALVGGTIRIRCDGQGVPFTSASSGRTLCEAVRSVSEDKELWLVDPVNGATARWGLGPVCKVRVTRLADDATSIGFSWHHAIGDMQTLMHFMSSWAAAAAGRPLAEPLIVEDHAAYLDEHLPADGAREPGVRFLGPAEIARSALYLAKDARKQRTLSRYFGEDEIARMREAHGTRTRLSANDVVCAHLSEALMNADPEVAGRSLAIVVNARSRCGLDPMLIGNVITTLAVDLRRGEPASLMAERIRHSVDHFADEHCDMRINQQFLDADGAWCGARCVSTAFNPARWNPLITNLSLRRVPHPVRGHLSVLLHDGVEVARRRRRCADGRGIRQRTGLSDGVAAQRIRGHVAPRDQGTHVPVPACRRRHSPIAPRNSRPMSASHLAMESWE